MLKNVEPEEDFAQNIIKSNVPVCVYLLEKQAYCYSIYAYSLLLHCSLSALYTLRFLGFRKDGNWKSGKSTRRTVTSRTSSRTRGHSFFCHSFNEFADSRTPCLNAENAWSVVRFSRANGRCRCLAEAKYGLLHLDSCFGSNARKSVVQIYLPLWRGSQNILYESTFLTKKIFV